MHTYINTSTYIYTYLYIYVYTCVSNMYIHVYLFIYQLTYRYPVISPCLLNSIELSSPQFMTVHYSYRINDFFYDHLVT